MNPSGRKRYIDPNSSQQDEDIKLLDSLPGSRPKINFYDRPPADDITLDQFETSALNRLRVLAEIESCQARNRTPEETKAVVKAQCSAHLPLTSPTSNPEDNDRLRNLDNIGHFVLRLAFSRSEDLRRRFVKAESTLFRTRYEDATIAEKVKFLESREFNWVLVGDHEKSKYIEELAGYYPLPKAGTRREIVEKERFYKVRWTRVPDLIEKRRVFMKGGWAYVPGKEQSSIIFREFDVQLEQAMEATARALPKLDEDTRLLPILDNLSQGFLAGVPSEWASASVEGNGDEIKAEMVDAMAQKHFPLCMRTFHEKLKREKHLVHYERLYFGLFLKVLGLPIEEAIIFWRKSFMGGKVTDVIFNREHKYNIRHSYGLEGRRANYPAKSCQQLISPEAIAHGCPYAHFKPENLQTALVSVYGSQGLTTAHLPEIMQMVKDPKTKHPHLACTRVFEITHGVKKGEAESITHPNEYAAKSIELEKAKTGDAMVVD